MTDQERIERLETALAELKAVVEREREERRSLVEIILPQVNIERVDLQRQVRDLAKFADQLGADAQTTIKTVNSLRAVMDKLATAMEGLVKDYTQFKMETIRRLTALITGQRPEPPPHGWKV